ncbi:MAG: Fe-S oxidoreductase, partial [Candidatus Methanomethylicota archaeon]
MIREAGFRYPRIAWDWEYSQYLKIEKQINLLKDAGYRSYDIYVFMLYNWDIPFEEMEKKRIKCWEWKVQIADCRYRPLDQTFDNYNPRVLGQT